MPSRPHDPVVYRGIRPGFGWTSDGYFVGMPSDGMYLDMPWTSGCVLTSGPKMRLLRPLRERKTFCWDLETVWIRSFEMRSRFPIEACQVVRPQKWEDLWQYFNCHDLWHLGAWNLWNLVYNLSELNDAWDRGIRARLASIPNCRMLACDAEFEDAVLKLKQAVQRDCCAAFHMGVFRDQYNNKSWPDGQLGWFDWEKHLQDLWACEPVDEEKQGRIQMSTEDEGSFADNGSDGDDKGHAAEEHADHESRENDAEAPGDNSDTTGLVDTRTHLSSEDMRTLANLTAGWAQGWIGRAGNKRKLCGWRRAFDILSVLSDGDWEVAFGGRRASGELRGLVRIELERLYHDHYPFVDGNAMSGGTHVKVKEVKGSGSQ